MQLHQLTQLEDFKVGDDDFEEIEIAHVLPLFRHLLIPVFPAEGFDVLELVQRGTLFR